MGIHERKEREKEARREEILNAAESVFFEKGLAETTMDEIAEKAELSKGTIYLYYKSKEDLFLAVTYRGMEIMYGLFSKAISSGGPPVKQLANLVEAYMEFFTHHRNYFRMMYFFENPKLQSQVSPDMLQRCHESDRRLWDLVISVVQQAIDDGMLHKDLDPLEVGIMLWSNTNGLMRLMDRTGQYWTEVMKVDLETMRKKSMAFLMEAMMTDRAKELYPPFTMFYHRSDSTTDSTSQAQ